jgi:Xaa-Pro aminopeptidase
MKKDSFFDFSSRTVHFGTPQPLEKEAFTRVLKGHINLATTIFPNKTTGNLLDSFARKFLWEVGLDFAHGTGHGVGSFLCVHEGPIGIANCQHPDDPGLQVHKSFQGQNLLSLSFFDEPNNSLRLFDEEN